jgi:hypothetical protein
MELAMIHPNSRLAWISHEVGVGVVATAPIPRGTVVWMRDAVDQTFTPAQVAAMPAPLRRQVELYSFIDHDGSFVLAWDHGRQMNHSCAPSCTSVGTLMEIAARDLAPGDELTCEYGLGFFIHGFTCTCGAPNCRGDARGPAGLEDWARWDRSAEAAWRAAQGVDQPLVAALTPGQAGAWLIEALRDRRAIALPSWVAGASAEAWNVGPVEVAAG